MKKKRYNIIYYFMKVIYMKNAKISRFISRNKKYRKYIK